MTILFTGNVPIQAGAFESAAFSVAGRKVAGVPLRIRISMDEATFPAGTTEISVFVSGDGGATYRSASGTYINPATWRGPGPHFWYLEYGFGADELATHVKYATDAPQAFTTNVILEAL
jgi:hypothetical protein